MQTFTFLNLNSISLWMYFLKNLFLITNLSFLSFMNSMHENNLPVFHDMVSITPHINPNQWKEKLQLAPQRFLVPHLQKLSSEKSGRTPTFSKGNLVLDPKYVVGLVEAEGCFSVCFLEKQNKVICEFSLTLTIADAPIIHSLKTFFGVGHVVISTTKIKFCVNRVWQIYYSILPFFDQHPLLGEKSVDILFFKQIVKLQVEEPILLQSIKTRKQTKYVLANFVFTYFCETKANRRRKISRKEFENWWPSSQNSPVFQELPVEYYNILALKQSFFACVPFLKPDPWYVTGFAEGDGGCTATVYSREIRHTFSFSSSQLEILQMLQQFFGFGKIYFIDLKKYNPKARPHWRLLISRRGWLYQLDKHFEKYPMFCSKAKFYKPFAFIVKATYLKKYMDSKYRRKLFYMIVNVNLKGKRRKIKKYRRNYIRV